MLCMAVDCFRECCQHVPTSRTAAPAPSSLSGCQGEEALKPDREFIRAKVSPGRPLPGREGRVPFSYSSTFLRWEMNHQLPLYARVAH